MVTELQQFESINGKAVWKVKMEEKLFTGKFILISNTRWKDEFVRFTMSVYKFHRQIQCSLQLVCEDRVLLSELIFTFIFMGSSVQNASERAIRLVYPPLFCKIRSSSNPTNMNLTDLGLEVQIALARYSQTSFSHNDRYYHLPS
jgi:hypothetical protein